MKFVDMDSIIESRSGTTVANIFAKKGEPHFRQLERDLLTELSAASGQVISTGGGVPVDPANREVMAKSGLVIRLKTSPETISARLARGQKSRGGTVRPLLGEAAPVGQIKEILEAREQAYASADVTIDTESRTTQSVADEISAVWQSVTSPQSDHSA